MYFSVEICQTGIYSLLTLESYLQKLKRKMLAFELRIKTPILNPLCKLVEPLASSEVAAHFLTIMGNRVCAPDVAEGAPPAGLLRAASAGYQWSAAAWAAVGLRLLTGKPSGGGCGSHAAGAEHCQVAWSAEARGKAGLLSKDLESRLYFWWRDFWNCEMEVFLLRSESFLFFL